MHSQIVKYLIVIIILVSSCSKTNKKHLFILSGQSNMELLNPYESFIPKLEEKIGQNKIIVIKDAKGGQPIRRWYKKWNEKNFKKTIKQKTETRKKTLNKKTWETGQPMKPVKTMATQGKNLGKSGKPKKH